jgi:hypothetical protein
MVYVLHPDLEGWKPMFCFPEDVEIKFKPHARLEVESRVKDYVPYFEEEVTLSPALPGVPEVSSWADVREAEIQTWVETLEPEESKEPIDEVPGIYEPEESVDHDQLLEGSEEFHLYVQG